MNEKKAIEIMTGWLSHKNELGRKPAKIKAAGSFSYEGNDYVILKFKPEWLGEWQVGVVGFDEEGNECGHTFSEYEKYDEATAKDKCIAIIEYMKEYWRGRFLAELERRGMTEEEYNSLTEEELEIFKEAAQISNEVELEEWDKQVEEAKQIAVETMGVEFLEVEVDAFKEKVMPLHQEMLSENPDIVEVYQEIQKMNEEMRKQVTEYEAAKEASIKAKATKTKSFTEPMPMSAMEAGLGMEWQSGWEFTENEGDGPWKE